LPTARMADVDIMRRDPRLRLRLELRCTGTVTDGIVSATERNVSGGRAVPLLSSAPSRPGAPSTQAAAAPLRATCPGQQLQPTSFGITTHTVADGSGQRARPAASADASGQRARPAASADGSQTMSLRARHERLRDCRRPACPTAGRIWTLAVAHEAGTMGDLAQMLAACTNAARKLLEPRVTVDDAGA
jgi:hypothetical protein